jgi:hypothetical protein
VGEAVAAFHHLHHAALDQLGGRQVLDALAAQLDAALGDLAALPLSRLEMARSVVVLPAPLPPSRATMPFPAPAARRP